MRSQFDLRSWPLVLWRNPLLFAMAFVLGGVAAFAYSYAPLHRAKDWRIDYLESRVESRNAQTKGLEVDLENARKSLAGVPSTEELQGMRAQLAEDSALVASGRREIDGLAAKLKRMTRSRDSWKSRHADAAAQVEELEQAIAGAAPAPPEPPAGAVAEETAADELGDASPDTSPAEASTDFLEPLPASPAPGE